jgi:predicted transcriptional regulator
MLRKTFVIIPIILLALSGCSSKSKDAAVTGAAPTVGAPAAPAATPTGTATPVACPTAQTRKLAKTRFITNAGLAAGAFKRYIYTPYRQGALKNGAKGQKRAVVKATAAGLFVLDQLRRAKANVQADPTLCKALSAPLRNLSSLIKGMVDKLKRGEIDPATIGAASGALEQTRGSAGRVGAGFKDKDVPVNMIGG